MKRINDNIGLGNINDIVSSLPSDAVLLISGFGSVGYPKEIPLALSNIDEDFSFTVISSGTVGEEIDIDMVESDIIDRRYPYISSSQARKAVNEGEIQLQDPHASSFGDEIQYGGLRRFVDSSEVIGIIEAVSVGDGWFIPSTSIGHTPVFVEISDKLILELNKAQPLELRHLHDIYIREKPPNRDPIPLSSADDRIGSSKIYFDPDKLEGVIKTEKKDSQSYTFEDTNNKDKKIARNLSSFLVEEVEKNPIFDEIMYLEFGVGRLGNTLMRALNSIDLTCDLVYFGEVIQDGLLDSLDSGKLKAASGTSLTLSNKGQEKLFNNIEKYSEDIVLRPVYITNNPSMIDRFGVVAINSALEVDIYGNVNSTHISGRKMVTGIGGSGDFNRNSSISIVAIPSIVSGGDISRIVPFSSHIDHTEHDIDIIVTEFGVADIRGLSPVERSKAIIECAHPKFRDDLLEYVENSDKGHIPHNLDLAFDWYS